MFQGYTAMYNIRTICPLMNYKDTVSLFYPNEDFLMYKKTHKPYGLAMCSWRSGERYKEGERCASLFVTYIGTQYEKLSHDRPQVVGRGMLSIQMDCCSSVHYWELFDSLLTAWLPLERDWYLICVRPRLPSACWGCRGACRDKCCILSTQNRFLDTWEKTLAVSNLRQYSWQTLQTMSMAAWGRVVLYVVLCMKIHDLDTWCGQS